MLWVNIVSSAEDWKLTSTKSTSCKAKMREMLIQEAGGLAGKLQVLDAQSKELLAKFGPAS